MTQGNTPISEVIRNRLQAAGIKYFANDNISEHIKEGELDLLQEEVTIQMQDLLKSLVIDVEKDHNTQDTAKRVAKMFVKEIFSGRYFQAPKVTEFPNASGYNGLYVVGPISIRSTCAHHLQNITGKCWIGIYPGEDVIGLSKFNRIADHICSRPQIQEEMTQQIADSVEELTKATGVAVVIKAHHACLTHRGTREHESDMTTAIMRGVFRDESHLKQEFYQILNNMKGMN